MNNTLIRKSVTTHIRKNDDDMKHVVADKLLHKLSTSDKYYNVIRKGEEAVKTSLFIASVFRGSPVPCSMDSKEESATESIRWTNDHTSLIEEEFTDVISGETEINIAIVKKRLESETLAEIRGNAKRVFDKLRYLKKKNKHDFVENLEEMREESLDEKLLRSGLVQVHICHLYLYSSQPSRRTG